MLPVSLILEDFMVFERAELRFDFPSALVVGEKDGDERRSNGAGKSSLFAGIEWVLWGESRQKTSDNVIRRGQIMCKGELVFEHNGMNYRIFRTRNIKTSKMEVQFEERRPDGSVVSLTHDTNKATDAEIRRVLKSNHDVFINSNYFRQNSFFEFVQGTFGTRQAIISSLLNLDKWNEYQKQAKEMFKQISDKVDAKKIELDRLDEVRARKEFVLIARQSLEDELAGLGKELVSLEEQLEALRLKVAEGRDTAAEYLKYRDLQGRVAAQKSSIEQVELQLSNKNEFLSRVEQDIVSNRAAAAQMADEMQAAIAKLNANKQTEPAQMVEAIIEGKSRARGLEQKIRNLLDSDACQMCGHEWIDSAAKQEFVSKLRTESEQIKDKLGRAEAKLLIVQQAITAQQQLELSIEKQKLKYSKLENGIEFGQLKKKATEEEVASANKQLGVLAAQLTELEATLKEIQNIEQSMDAIEAEEALKSKEADKKACEKKRSELLFKTGGLAKEVEVLDAQIASLIKLEGEIKLLARQAAVYGQLSRAFSKDGIQAIIVDNIIEELTRQTNYWLAQFSTDQTYVEFITQKRNTKGDWRETFELEIHTPSGPSQFEDFSGGEQFRIGFAIRLALSTIQAKRMGGEMQLLMLDEVSTSLDASGLEVFVDIIRRLEREMKVMVISHDDKLKEEFQHIITVKKTASGSTVEVK